MFFLGLLSLVAMGFSAFRMAEKHEKPVTNEMSLLPDLVIGNMKMRCNVNRSFTVRVKNIGTKKSATSTLLIKPLGTEAERCLGQTLFIVPSIVPGRERVFRINLKPENSRCNCHASFFKIEIAVDPDNFLLESDETNNEAFFDGEGE